MKSILCSRGVYSRVLRLLLRTKSRLSSLCSIDLHLAPYFIHFLSSISSRYALSSNFDPRSRKPYLVNPDPS